MKKVGKHGVVAPKSYARKTGKKSGNSSRVNKTISTSPANYTPGAIPSPNNSKIPVVTMKKLSIARTSMPNMQGAETSAKMNSGPSMSSEGNLRKVRRMKQGL